MKSLDRKKSRDLFERFNVIAEKVRLLGGVVQNPDFVNQENAEENIRIFMEQFKVCEKELCNVAKEVLDIHEEIVDSVKKYRIFMRKL